MTKQAAIQAMESGKKVTHTYFDDDEWITMKNGQIVTEEGYKHDAVEFWSWTTGPRFDDGYCVID